MDKKKYLNLLYMFSLVALFAIFLGLFSNCYAMTEEEVTQFLDYAKDFYNEKYGASFSENIFNTYYNYKNSFTNFDRIGMTDQGINNYFLVAYNKLENTANICLFYNANNSFHIAITARKPNYHGSFTGVSNNGTNFTYNSNYGVGYNNINSLGYTYIITNDIVYNGFRSEDEYESTNYLNTNNIVTNTITLTSASNHKFGFTDKNQLQVEFTGEWTPADFTFYVERYIDNEWQQFSDINDWYELNGYDNPYYFFWPNINYYPVGTYRYCALYGNNPEQAYYSQNFEITNNIINNPTTGTINSDGDININIDTGKTVDDIKDYLGQEPDNANSDIENSVTDIQNNLENEFGNNDIITTLETAELGFLEILREPQRDFVISWDNILFENEILIPAGNVNFSEMCRDNETLGRVKHYINIIISFGIAIAIVKYIYNLFLATLGLDNHLLFEQNEDSTSFTADTSSGTVTYRTRTKNGNTIIHKGSMKGKEN